MTARAYYPGVLTTAAPAAPALPPPPVTADELIRERWLWQRDREALFISRVDLNDDTTLITLVEVSVVDSLSYEIPRRGATWIMQALAARLRADGWHGQRRA